MEFLPRAMTDYIERMFEQFQRHFFEAGHTMYRSLPMFQYLEHPNARALRRATSRSVGYDLFPVTSFTVRPNSTAVVDTGIRVILPAGCYAKIESRSGLASQGVFARAGVIDPDYTGTLRVILENRGQQPYQIQPSRAVAQLVLAAYIVPDNITTLTTLDGFMARHRATGVNDRNENGFGSSDRRPIYET